MFDRVGTPVQGYLYDSYENITQTTRILEKPFTDTSRELDIESGSNFYHTDYYEPSTEILLNENQIDFPRRDVYFDNYIGNYSINFTDIFGNYSTAHIVKSDFGPQEDLFDEPLLTQWDELIIDGSICKVTGKLILKTPGKIVTRGKGPVIKGKQGVAKGIAQAKTNGETVLGKEITIDTTAGRTKIDILTRTKEGKLKFIECKNGPYASLTPNQKNAFQKIQSEGGIPKGINAEKAGLISGKPIGPTEVQVLRFLP